MNNLIPSQDQIMGQLRILIPALGTIATTLGVSGATANHYVDMSLAMVGPLAYFVGAGWSLYANTRKSIMTAAAKPAEVGLPPPQIVLPTEESALAHALPENVQTSNDAKVVQK